MPASTVAARGNTIFPVETFGDTLIVLPKGDKAGFGEANFRVECGRVAAALRDPRYPNLVLDFSLTNYVGGNVVEELQRWVAQVREQGGRAVACEVSDDMRKGLEVSRRAEDWEFFDTRDEALGAVATETFGQTLGRWTPTIATVLTVLLLVGLGAWLLSGRHTERRHYTALVEIWQEYSDLRKKYPNVREWAERNKPLVERLDREIEEIRPMLPSKYSARNTLLSTAERRMKPILLRPRSPDPRARGVESGLALLRANLEGAPTPELRAAQKLFNETRPTAADANPAASTDTPAEEPANEEPEGAESEATDDVPPVREPEPASEMNDPQVDAAPEAGTDREFQSDPASGGAFENGDDPPDAPPSRAVPISSGRSPS